MHYQNESGTTNGATNVGILVPPSNSIRLHVNGQLVMHVNAHPTDIFSSVSHRSLDVVFNRLPFGLCLAQ
jgi:hypothetical protein